MTSTNGEMYTCPVPSLRLLSLEYYEENRENLIINRNQSTNISAPGFKKWGGKKGATIDYGGGKHVRVAHIASAKRKPICLNCWGPIFFWARARKREPIFFFGGGANMCAERT